MSLIIFPDNSNTDWIAWKKISKKTNGVETSRFRWTSEKFVENSTTLPEINVSHLNISLKPSKTNKKTCPRPFNSQLPVQLPPFSGYLKARQTHSLFPKPKVKEYTYLSNSMKSELIPRANFITKASSSRQEAIKKINRIVRKQDNKDKFEGIIGVKMLDNDEKIYSVKNVRRSIENSIIC